jgi:hypothetical protein
MNARDICFSMYAGTAMKAQAMACRQRDMEDTQSEIPCKENEE